jgi:hypothetical protein
MGQSSAPAPHRVGRCDTGVGILYTQRRRPPDSRVFGVGFLYTSHLPDQAVPPKPLIKNQFFHVAHSLLA